MSTADLTKPLADALNDEIQRRYAKGKIPRNRADANRHMIRAVQRFMDDQRAHIRAVADKLIRDADEKYATAIVPAHKERVQAIETHERACRIFVDRVDEEYREAIAPFRSTRDREVESIRDDVSARMSEADAIVKSSIRSIKKADFEEMKRAIFAEEHERRA